MAASQMVLSFWGKARYKWMRVITQQITSIAYEALYRGDHVSTYTPVCRTEGGSRSAHT